MRNRIAVALVIAACNKSSGPPLLLVANTAEATLSVLELPAGNELARLPTGIGPHEVAVSPDGQRAVVSNYGNSGDPGRTLTVVDLTDLSVANAIDLGELRLPHGIAFLDDRRVVVTAELHGSIAIIDVDAGNVERVISTAQQGSHMLAVAPGAQRVYVANIESGSITPIDLATATPGEPVPAIATSEAIAVAPDGAEVWTASVTQNRIVIFDAPQLRRDAELAAAGAPTRITPTPDGKTMLVSNTAASKLQLVDVATRAIATIDVPFTDGGTAAPAGTTIASDSKTAYVALVAQDRVAVVDLPTMAITGHLLVGKGPDGVAYCAAR